MALALHAQGFEIDFLVSKDLEKISEIVGLTDAKNLVSKNLSFIRSDLIIISTQDFEIENVAALLAEKLKSKPTILHTSGSLSSEVLSKLTNDGFETGSFHPLVSVSDPFLGSERFQNAFFCVEGSKKAVKTGKLLAEKLGGKSFSIRTENKILYHASAVTACGHLVALFDVSLEMLKKCGLSDSAAKEILMPLVESTVKNLKSQKPENALTGTFARADFDIFEKHLQTLEKNVSENAVDIYLDLGMRSIELAEKAADGKNKSSKFEKIRKTILLAKKTRK